MLPICDVHWFCDNRRSVGGWLMATVQTLRVAADADKEQPLLMLAVSGKRRTAQ
jgi:hypothetical protein